MTEYTDLIIFEGPQANREYRSWLGQSYQAEVELVEGYIANNDGFPLLNLWK